MSPPLTCRCLHPQAHQLHYIFFGFTCAHWSYGLFYMAPSATFYAADIVLRWHGTYNCAAATARVHGQNQGKEPTMTTLVLPVSNAASTVATAAGSCPYLRSRREHGSVTPLPPVPAPAPSAGNHISINSAPIEPSFATDPWAGTTCYLQIRSLSPLSQMGGWSHPFTVAGSIRLNTNDSTHALLVHIAPERRWTLSLTRSAWNLGFGADARMAHVSVTSPLPAPPNLENLAHSVMAGMPLLLIGAGSGVTPAVALIRMLAGRTLPATARVRLVVIVRSMHVAEALDGYMLPASADGTTGLPWLTSELHLTRRVAAESAEGPSTQSGATPHCFQGGFRLRPAGDGTLRAASAPYCLVDAPDLVGGIARFTGLRVLRVSRHMAVDEILSILGAFVGFISVTWTLVGAAADAPAPWSYKPTAVSGMGALLLGWVCALAGAWLALLICDAFMYCYSATMARRGATSASGTAQPPDLSAEAAPANSLIVPLTSNGTRPCVRARLMAFMDQVAKTKGETAETFHAKQSEMLVAAGGPQVLLDSIKKVVPKHMHLTKLTHPM